MQATPALPWSSGSGGSIQLAENVTFNDLKAGKIIIIAATTSSPDNQVVLKPVEGSSQIFYKNGSDQIASISRFEGSTNELGIVPDIDSENYVIQEIRIAPDVPEVTVEPSLPWTNATTMGTITVEEPVTFNDLVQGALQFGLDNNGSEIIAKTAEDYDGLFIGYETDGELSVIYIVESFEGEATELSIIRTADESAGHSMNNVYKA